MDSEPKANTYTIIWSTGREELATRARPDIFEKPEWWLKKKRKSFFVKYLETTQTQFEIMTKAYLALDHLYSKKLIEDKISQLIYQWAGHFTQSANYIISLIYSLVAQKYPLIYSEINAKAMIEMIIQANDYTQKIQALRMDCVLNRKFPNTNKFSEFFEADSLELSKILNNVQNIQKLAPNLQINFMNNMHCIKFG